MELNTCPQSVNAVYTTIVRFIPVLFSSPTCPSAGRVQLRKKPIRCGRERDPQIHCVGHQAFQSSLWKSNVQEHPRHSGRKDTTQQCLAWVRTSESSRASCIHYVAHRSHLVPRDFSQVLAFLFANCDVQKDETNRCALKIWKYKYIKQNIINYIDFFSNIKFWVFFSHLE